MDDLRTGTLVGADAMGNKYYENNNYFFGKLLRLVWYKLILDFFLIALKTQ